MSVEQNIYEKLNAAFSPVHLEVINESDNHHVPPNSETHFKVIVATEVFEGKRLLARHRSVNELLADELANGVHALSMHTFTPSEWQTENDVPVSPKCRG
ncbi:BolA/IbaG family iron-sulfur metabolism protein [Shewanella sp. Isolate11]|uniref:BolA family protein n=1 Tax=Shewanella sp. Isolate11 TaxID=2908530 RepID=UPI001EFEE16E|nr:BolA/IbaG family iron-sulfur metabolism protein [Shewanella sp. Isolate11]MCG9697376.1 BolA/IbaG family iron-sulfur metabolism protein [Shewanella sp. Isolate11]